MKKLHYNDQSEKQKILFDVYRVYERLHFYKTNNDDTVNIIVLSQGFRSHHALLREKCLPRLAVFRL